MAWLVGGLLGLLLVAADVFGSWRHARLIVFTSVLGVVVGVIDLAGGFSAALAPRGGSGRGAQLRRFAHRNGLVYADDGPSGALVGLASVPGRELRLLGNLRCDDPTRTLALAGHVAWRDTDGETGMLPWQEGTVIVLRLPARLPHIALDDLAAGGGALTHGRSIEATAAVPLPAPLSDRHRLFAEEGFSLDALQLFSPDVLWALDEQRLGFDLEIVDRWLFLYGPAGALVEADTWRRLDWFCAEFLPRLLRPVGRYTDRRAPEPETLLPPALQEYAPQPVQVRPLPPHRPSALLQAAFALVVLAGFLMWTGLDAALLKLLR